MECSLANHDGGIYQNQLIKYIYIYTYMVCRMILKLLIYSLVAKQNVLVMVVGFCSIQDWPTNGTGQIPTCPSRLRWTSHSRHLELHMLQADTPFHDRCMLNVIKPHLLMVKPRFQRGVAVGVFSGVDARVKPYWNAVDLLRHLLQTPGCRRVLDAWQPAVTMG